ncbi:POLG alternative reading frame-like [Caloenas nicobarica]|uniref:POLG alternative reading frame-like n=1 Tax=Caloenas nicobarica TaxID=187106 RepID=UPI0032B857C3
MARRGRALRCPAGARVGVRCPPAPGRAGQGLRRGAGPGEARQNFRRGGLRCAPRPRAAVLPEPRAAAAAAAAAATQAACGTPRAVSEPRPAAPARSVAAAADGPALINTPATCGMCARPAARSRGAAARGWSPPGTARRRSLRPLPARDSTSGQSTAAGRGQPSGNKRRGLLHVRAGGVACTPASPTARGVGVASAIEEFSPRMSRRRGPPAPPARGYRHPASPCSAGPGLLDWSK